MIVKIERHNNEQKWWLIDNIKKISCSKKGFYSTTKTPSDLSNYNIVLLDHNPKCNCSNNEKCKKCISYYILTYRDDEYNEFNIIFDTIAYLCNDDGKTIEKIVANYKE